MVRNGGKTDAAGGFRPKINMALYVKVFTAFFTSKKTIRLRATIGDDALWLPIRIWAYAAENQPDGDFSGYSAQELALLVGYGKDACSMLEALHHAGFFVDNKIHQWDEHNSYHKAFSEKAKLAAEARWAKHNEKKRLKEETSNASSIPSPARAESPDEVVAYCRTLSLPDSDGTACFDKWTGNGWKNGGDPIKDWKATIRSWKTQGYLPSQKNGTTPKERPPLKLRLNG